MYMGSEGRIAWWRWGVSRAGWTVLPNRDHLSVECPEHVVPLTGRTSVISALPLTMALHHEPRACRVSLAAVDRVPRLQCGQTP